jgi:hypothetical protein
MLASFSEFERATITERSRDGLRRAFKEGRHLGRIPSGYDVNADGAFEIVEDEARVVRRILTNMAAGATLYSEAKRLNDEGEPSPGQKYRNWPRKHGPCWHDTTVRSIVTALHPGESEPRRNRDHLLDAGTVVVFGFKDAVGSVTPLGS